jgi:arginine-tRNA-protein transferase
MENDSVGAASDLFGAGAEASERGVPCPYGQPHEHRALYFVSESCEGARYEEAMKDGWRRSGLVFYRNRCSECCEACVPIRVDAENIEPGKTQRRIIRMNEDLSVSAARASFEAEDYALFMKYMRTRHPEEAKEFDEMTYYRAYVASPVETAIVRYRTTDGRLVALSWLDALADGFSSVYFAFDPDEARRSLGVYSVFAESAILRSLGKRWYYLGFWVSACRKMAYKSGFRPHQIAKDGEWVCCTNSD